MKISITICYKHENKDDRLLIVIRLLWGLVKIKKTYPSIKINKEDQSIDVKKQTKPGAKKEKSNDKISTDDVQRSLHQMNEIKKQVVHLHTIIKRFLKHVHVDEFCWISEIGLHDAAATGVICGSAWTIKGSCIALLDQNMIVKKRPVIDVTPSFFLSSFKTDVTCILSFRMGHAMGAVIRLLTYWRGNKRKLGRSPQPIESES
jgi:hypothetical protein